MSETRSIFSGAGAPHAEPDGASVQGPFASATPMVFAPALRERRFDVVVTRGGTVESRHRVHAAVVDANGTLLEGVRDPHTETWWRSCAKPFQVMPLVRAGGLERLGWGSSQLALACASHGGEPEHVALAESMLAGIGLEEGDLACGAHEPLASRGARLLRESGDRVTRLHNNCSGKHAAMLARAVLLGEPTTGYEQASHAVQRAAHETVATWAGMTPEQVRVAVDGCGVTVFSLPLANMALSYARLAHASTHGDETSRRIVHAMTTHPFLVGGSDRFDTRLMEAIGGNVLCKVGAEGVHTFAILDRGIGFALKVEDGSQRAQFVAVLAMLAEYGGLPSPLPESLRDAAVRAVRNTRGEQVGEVFVSVASLGAPVRNDAV
ncbi:asparaginase [Gemmatimonas sp.]|uniref:asparaginase n=1 Tax=Gemmatimonas sp. TaxID=1962908 RepID=UPI00286CE7B5|nr:asparaginase [Gemmatimonas sp.]